MVDNIGPHGKIINFPQGGKPREEPDIKAIAEIFFDTMTTLADGVIDGKRPIAVFNAHMNSLWEIPLSFKQKEKLFEELVRLSKDPSVDRTILPMINPELDQLKLLLDIYCGDNVLGLRSRDNVVGLCSEEDFLDLCFEDDLVNLHRAPNIQNIPPWSKGMQELLAETPIVEGDRIMLGDNFAHLYNHHLNLFMMHKRDSAPYWDIVNTATFVLDFADEEFSQEQEYDRKQLMEFAQPKMLQKEITLNDLKPDSLDPFNEKRLEKKYSTDSGIILTSDFKDRFLSWIENNLHDFHGLGLEGSPLGIFNQLCVSAKKGQALRLDQEKK